MSEQDVVLSSRVRLARNYEDLPFDLGEKPEAAAMCVARTVQALGLEEGEPQGNLIRLRDILAELEARVEPLRIQSEKAKKFLEYAEQKKILEIIRRYLSNTGLLYAGVE